MKEYKLNTATINDILEKIPLDRLDAFVIDFKLFMDETIQKAKDNPDSELESLELTWIDDGRNDVDIEWKTPAKEDLIEEFKGKTREDFVNNGSWDK